MTTNYERIKNMTIKQIAEFLKETNYSVYDFTTTKKAIAWLQTESGNE